MTQTLTTIGHRTAFNNKQSPYCIVSYKRPRYDNVNKFKRENQIHVCAYVLTFTQSLSMLNDELIL